ncbi:unnamed protein product [Durusdinium trenchii]|uniref:Uncharacterized protein n=1 Tax=Durusdinium trenchii TaxID=1381693 RepID=A0ABP0K191_9DINO
MAVAVFGVERLEVSAHSERSWSDQQGLRRSCWPRTVVGVCEAPWNDPARILQEMLARLNPHSTIEEPTQGTRSNGARRSALEADYDFTLDVRKIECKSAQMSWDKFLKCWRVRFCAVKMPWPGFRDQAPFDDLYLTVFSPDSLHIIKHDLQAGVTTAGKRTGSSGHEITVRGARGQECWQTALSQILDKFLAAGHCELVARIDLSATKARAFLAQQMEGLATRQDTEYEGVPLSQITPALRGLRIEEIAFEVDRVLYPNCIFSRTSSKVDWFRGEVRVEVKHGMMRFDKGHRRWMCSFRNIKCDLFDELWLAIYSPFGIHFLKHPGGQVRFSLTGLKEEARGKEMHVLGSQHLLDVREALDDMLKKMEEWGCQRLATILW